MPRLWKPAIRVYVSPVGSQASAFSLSRSVSLGHCIAKDEGIQEARDGGLSQYTSLETNSRGVFLRHRGAPPATGSEEGKQCDRNHYHMSVGENWMLLFCVGLRNTGNLGLGVTPIPTPRRK